MTERATPNSEDLKTPYQKVLAGSYYELLGLHPSASAREIRQAYRDLSKLYHPDTTTLPTTIATTQFQKLNEAYATLSNPERRSLYDRKIGYSSVAVVRTLPNLHRSSSSKPSYTSSAYLDPTDRPLSPGEIFALFILGLTFVGCLCLAIAIGLTRGDTMLQTATVQKDPVQQTVQQPGQPSPISPIPQTVVAPSTPPLPIPKALLDDVDTSVRSVNEPLPNSASEHHSPTIPKAPS